MARTFVSEPRIKWYRSPIERETLQALMVRSDLRGWLQTLLHLGWFATTGALAYAAWLTVNADNWVWGVPLLLAALFLHGTMGPFMGLIAIHELQHRTVFKTRWLNGFFEVLYSFISWSDYLWYRESHVQHHMSTCHRDYDGEVQLPVRFSLRRWGVWVGFLAWNPKATWARLKLVWRHARGDVRGDWYEHLFPESKPAPRQRHRNWHRILLAGHGLLAAIFVVTGHPFLIVVFTFGTQYCGWLGFLCGVPQHFALNSDVPDFRMNTRTFTCSWLPAFYYWNMQYHLEHHMYPAVPFFNLPKLRAAIEDDLPPATHGLYATWKDLLAIRRRVLTEPGYEYVPAVPQLAAAAAGDSDVADRAAEHRVQRVQF